MTGIGSERLGVRRLALWTAVVLGAVFVGTPSPADDEIPLEALRVLDVHVQPLGMRYVLRDIDPFARRHDLASRVYETWDGVSIRLQAMNLTIVGQSGGALGLNTLRLIAYDGIYSAAGEGLWLFDALKGSVCALQAVTCDLLVSAPSDSGRTPRTDALPTYGVIEVTMARPDRQDIINLAEGFLYAKGFASWVYSTERGVEFRYHDLRMTVIETLRLTDNPYMRFEFTDGPIRPTPEEAAALIDEMARVIASRPAATVTISR